MQTSDFSLHRLSGLLSDATISIRNANKDEKHPLCPGVVSASVINWSYAKICLGTECILPYTCGYGDLIKFTYIQNPAR